MNATALAFCFPGQGSQSVGMLSAIAAAEPVIRETFEEAGEILNEDLWTLAQQGPAEQQRLTVNAQPLLLTSGVALWRLWQRRSGPEPGLMTGHSLGEFTALVCAESLDFAEALHLVRRRGELMQEAVPVGLGAMAAILGLDQGKTEACCAEVADSRGETVQAVNINAPGQVVIAGHTEAVRLAGEQCIAAGARRVTPLPVSAPFHTELMRPAAQQLAQALDQIRLRSPKVPVIHNVHADSESEPSQIAALLCRQLYSPVQWVACVRKLVSRGAQMICEPGPGKVLCGLNRRIDSALHCYALESVEGFEKALAATSSMELSS